VIDKTKSLSMEMCIHDQVWYGPQNAYCAMEAGNMKSIRKGFLGAGLIHGGQRTLARL
jgi:hypothetical protein